MKEYLPQLKLDSEKSEFTRLFTGYVPTSVRTRPVTTVLQDILGNTTIEHWISINLPRLKVAVPGSNPNSKWTYNRWMLIKESEIPLSNECNDDLVDIQFHGESTSDSPLEETNYQVNFRYIRWPKMVDAVRAYRTGKPTAHVFDICHSAKIPKINLFTDDMDVFQRKEHEAAFLLEVI